MTIHADSHEYTPAGNKRCLKFCKDNNGCHPQICPQNKAFATGCSVKSRNLMWKGIAQIWETYHKKRAEAAKPHSTGTEFQEDHIR